ncbi:hypothetical protein [Aquipuribacter nitratireducens]|uniref:Uncharacterized protein n=1 Tax=Aquipuribacter nitratireducens TaxID=650104 RepID=A0ABW0GLV3_9MICO
MTTTETDPAATTTPLRAPELVPSTRAPAPAETEEPFSARTEAEVCRRVTGDRHHGL